MPVGKDASLSGHRTRLTIAEKGRAPTVKLIIVESPAKAKALQGFLGREYEALATMEA